MSRGSSASMYGGLGQRGPKASVSSLEGLRNVLRNETERDSAPVQPAAAPTTSSAPAPSATPAPPADDKQTLRGLNGRLSGYLDRVKQLHDENRLLQKEIDDILAKRKVPAGRDWDEVQKPVEDLKKKVKDITTDNAKLLLQIDNTKLANDDFKNKLDDEIKACKELEKDLENLKRVSDDTKINCEQTKKEIDMVKDELNRIKKEHKDEVDSLLDKIKDSDIKVVIDSPNSNLAEILNKVREQYEKVANKNLKETEDWYNSKFESIKVEEAQNVEALQSGKNELKDLKKQKQTLEIQIQGSLNTIRNLEETLRNIKIDYGQRMVPSNKIILNLEAELKEVRSQVEQQLQNNKDLLCIKMKLEEEINSYQELLSGLFANPEGSETK